MKGDLVEVRGLSFVEISRSKIGFKDDAGESIYRSAVDGFHLDVVEHTGDPRAWPGDKPFEGTVWCGVPFNHRTWEQRGDRFDEVVDLLISTKALWGYLLKRQADGSVSYAKEQREKHQRELEMVEASAQRFREDLRRLDREVEEAEQRRDAVHALRRPTDGLSIFIERMEYEITMIRRPHLHWSPAATVWFDRALKWAQEIRDGETGAHAPEGWRERVGGG